MGFLKKVKICQPNSDNKFKKKRTKRTLALFFSIIGIIAISFFAYLYATGSKMFDRNTLADSILLKAIRGDDNKIGSERINFLLMGRGGDKHPGGLLTDSIMVVSIEPKTKSLAMISVPRDLYVPIKNHGQDKINSAFSDGYNDYIQKNCTKKKQDECKNGALSAGANMTKQTVSETLGIPIQYYAMIDFYGFVKFIDEIGGVDITVDKSIYDPFYPDENMKGYSPFSIKAGQQHLNGETALKYARSRETTSDFDRSRRQQQLIYATKEKVLKIGFLANPKKIIDIATILGDHVRTDLSPAELKALTEFVNQVDASKIITKVLSNGEGGPLVSDSSSGTYYLKPRKGDFSELKSIAQNIFSESSDKEENAKIEIINASNITGTGGKLGTYLREKKYNIVNIGTTKEIYKKTIIYDYSSGNNKDTISYLKNYLNADVIEKTSPANKSVDISIVIGEDYKVK